MGESESQRFGRYRLIRRLAQGGMAEIWIAREDTQPNVDLVVKRIHEHLADDEQFVMMFLDEARIAARLDHSGCVEIFDLGRFDNSYYIAMEYIHGEDVRSLARQARKMTLPLPRKLAIAIVAGAAEGLHYAHNLKDTTSGRNLNVVHRDVSPQNILVTYNGGVKIVDFGIAKAADQANKTQAGVLKGKYAYMSPEQVRGLPLDRRSDVFSLGILLYELTTGKRLFKARTELETMKRISGGQIVPPTQASPGYPVKLERILLKALATNRDERYESADALKRDLLKFLADHRSSVSANELASFMRNIFAERLEAEQAAQALGDHDALLKARFGEESDSEESGNSSSRPHPSKTQEGKRPAADAREVADDSGVADDIEIDLSLDEEEIQSAGSPPAPEASSLPPRPAPEPSQPRFEPPEIDSRTSSDAPLSNEEIDTLDSLKPRSMADKTDPGQPPLHDPALGDKTNPESSSPLESEDAKDSRIPTFKPALGDFETFDLDNTATDPTARTDVFDDPFETQRPRRRRRAIFAVMVLLGGIAALLFLTDLGGFLKEVGREGMSATWQGQETESMETAGTKPEQEPSQDAQTEERVHGVKMAQEPDAAPEADLAAAEEPQAEEEPREKEPATSKQRRVEAPSEPSQPTRKQRPQPPRPRVGHVSITADAPGVVMLDGNEIGEVPLSRHQLPPGNHDFLVKGEEVERRVRVQLRAGQNISRSVSLRQGLLRVRAVPWAEIHMGGKHVGTTPMAPFRVPAGNHTIEAHNPDLNVRRQVSFTMEPDGELLLTIDLTED